MAVDGCGGKEEHAAGSALIDALPKIRLVTISIAEMQSMRMALSAPVDAAVPRVVEQVWQLIE